MGEDLRSKLDPLYSSDMENDWRYSDEKMGIRQLCYSHLLSNFGSNLTEEGHPAHTMKSITECVHDWVSQGSPDTRGLTQFYLKNYE